MHKRLEQQLQSFFAEQRITDPEQQQRFEQLLQAINEDYLDADRENASLQQALAQTAKELVDRNKDLHNQLERKLRAEKELKRTVSLLRSTLDASVDAMVVVNREGKPTIYNNNFVEMWKLDNALLGKLNSDALYSNIELHLRNPYEFNTQRDQIERFSEASRHTYQLIDGRVIECDVTQNQKVGLVWSFRDVTEKQRQEERLLYQAHHDELTELPNRTLLNDRISHAIEKAKRRGTKLALLNLDLDGFKKINDSLGHDVGDVLLIEVASRLTHSVRGEDTVARMGGDEFIVLAEDITNEDIIAHLAERLLSLFHKPIKYQEQDLFTSTSIGIAIYPDDGEEAGVLIKHADIALYQAKDAGRNNYHYFTSSMEQQAHNRLSMENQLRTAVKNGSFEMHYQPEFDIASGRLIGFEALIRWPTEDGIVPPFTFIPVAESTGLIIPLGDWIIDNVCQQIRQWREQGLRDFFVAINLSPKQFQHQDIYSRVIDTLARNELPADCLAIEITESMVMENVGTAVDILRRFQQQGIKVCMDDFGTGYSSLNYLKNLPIDVLKIDRSFIRDITESRQNRAIAASIISLGKNLGLKIVAEGVEDEKQLGLLGDLECDIVQGYLLGKPAPAAQAMQFFTARDEKTELLKKGSSAS